MSRRIPTTTFCGAVFCGLALLPATASATVTAEFERGAPDELDTLTVESDIDGDDIWIDCEQLVPNYRSVTVNGEFLSSYAYPACDEIEAIEISGGEGQDKIDLSPVRPEDFRDGDLAARHITANAGEGSDEISGSPFSEVLGARPGLDDGSLDVIRAGAGADLVDGGSTGDLIHAGPGDDEIRGGDGPDIVSGAAGDDVASGGPSPDRIGGGPGNDRLAGDEDRDTLSGSGGHDLLLGGPAADLLRGDAGRDRLRGGRGPDRLEGGRGRDKLKGGTGRDQGVQ